MTNIEKLKAMTLDELAEWLDKNGMFDNSPWMNWFNKNYCEKCESIKIAYTDVKEKLNLEPWFGHTIECAFCELADESGVKKCRFFPEFDDVPDNKEMIKMWLSEEADND
jgi:hypothetical protein